MLAYFCKAIVKVTIYCGVQSFMQKKKDRIMLNFLCVLYFIIRQILYLCFNGSFIHAFFYKLLYSLWTEVRFYFHILHFNVKQNKVKQICGSSAFLLLPTLVVFPIVCRKWRVDGGYHTYRTPFCSCFLDSLSHKPNYKERFLLLLSLRKGIHFIFESF